MSLDASGCADDGATTWCAGCGRYPGVVTIAPGTVLCRSCTADGLGLVDAEADALRVELDAGELPPTLDDDEPAFACAGVDETAGGYETVRAELVRTMREGALRALDPETVVVTVTPAGRAALRELRGDTRLWRDLRAMGRLQGEPNE